MMTGSALRGSALEPEPAVFDPVAGLSCRAAGVSPPGSRFTIQAAPAAPPPSTSSASTTGALLLRRLAARESRGFEARELSTSSIVGAIARSSLLRALPGRDDLRRVRP